MPIRRAALGILACAATLAGVASATSAPVSTVATADEVAVRGGRVQLQYAPTHVTFIADSGLKGLELYGGTPTLRQANATTQWELRMQTCRRLVQRGCSFNRSSPPIPAVDEIRLSGGPRDPSHVILMTVGHNDHPLWFRADFETVMLTARSLGYRRVAWILYRDDPYTGLSSLGRELFARYAGMNAILRDEAASGRWPELVLIDYDGFTQPHPEWFISDGIHLRPEGAEPLATWFAQMMLYSSTPALRVD